MLNLDLIKNILIIAIGGGIVTTSLVQKIKESINLKSSKWLILCSFVISMIIGTLFALSFSDITIKFALWVGLFSFIGADLIYKAFEDKIFKPFSEVLAKKSEIVPLENEITFEEKGDE